MAGTLGKNTTVKNILYALIIVVLLIYTIFPLYWLFLASLKTRVDLFTIPPKFFFEPTISHFKKIFIYTTLETFLKSVAEDAAVITDFAQ